MLKKSVLIIFILCIYFNVVFANDYRDYYIYDEDANPLDNVFAIGWECNPTTDSTCVAVNLGTHFTIYSMPIQSGTFSGFPINFMRIEFTAAQQNNDYYIYYVNSDI